MTVAKRVVVACPMEEALRERIRSVLGPDVSLSFLSDEPDSSRSGTIRNSDAILCFFFNREIRPEEYALLGSVRFLQTISTGVDFLPFSSIPESLPIACNAGGWSSQIAEHTLAMILSLSRKLLPLHEELRRGCFHKEEPVLRTLRGKTAGIIGYGGIGKRVANLLRAFGVKIAAVNSSGKTSDDVVFCGTLDDLHEGLRLSDIVVMSLPLMRRTKNVIGRAELAAMKSDAIFVNVARAHLVDEEALYEHCMTHPDFCAGIDVWWREPTWGGGDFSLRFPFLDLPNVLGSPHNSNSAEEGFADAAVVAAGNVARFLRGEICSGRVNRDDYSESVPG
jgi:glycerate dehydrogenase